MKRNMKKNTIMSFSFSELERKSSVIYRHESLRQIAIMEWDVHSNFEQFSSNIYFQ